MAKWQKVEKNFPEEMFPEGEGQEAIPTTYVKKNMYLLEIVQFLLQFLSKGSRNVFSRILKRY